MKNVQDILYMTLISAYLRTQKSYFITSDRKNNSEKILGLLEMLTGVCVDAKNQVIEEILILDKVDLNILNELLINTNFIVNNKMRNLLLGKEYNNIFSKLLLNNKLSQKQYIDDEIKKVKKI